MDKKKVFPLIIISLLLVAGGFFAHRNFVIAGLLEDATLGVEDIGAVIEEGRKYMMDDQPFPNVNMQTVSPFGIQTGGELSIKSTIAGFVMTEPIHYSWCVDEIPYMGIAAGSKDVINGKEGDYYLENRYGRVEGGSGVCKLYKRVNDGDYKKLESTSVSQNADAKAPSNFYMNRIPNIDSDEDGLDDQWEIRSFGGRRKPGTNTFFSSRDEEVALLNEVKPNDDWDKDGWKFSYYSEGAKKATAPGGAPLPGSTEIHSPFKAPWMMGLPYAKNNITGDDKFTNYEEYVFNLDPLALDTDQDGVGDEADVAGLNQAGINLRVTKKAGSAYQIALYAFGTTSRWEANKNDSARAAEKYFRADFPNKRKAKGLKINEDKEAQLVVSEGMMQQININHSPNPIFRGDEVTVNAEVISLSSAEDTRFIYNWYKDGEQTDEAKKQSGLGKNTFKFKADDYNQCEIGIGLEIINKDTQKLDYKEITIPVGLGLGFKKEILGNATDNASIAAFNDKNNANTADYKNSLSLAADDLFLSEVNTDDVGFRKGDLVNFSTSDLKNSYNPVCYDNKPFEEFEKSLTYSWRINGVPQWAKNGEGKEFASIKYVLSESPRANVKNNISDPNSMFLEGQEAISVEIKNSENRVVAAKTERLKVIPPYVKFSVENADPISSPTSQNASAPTFIAKVGKNIKVNAHLYNFRPTAEGLTFIWSRNNQESVKEERVFSNQASYEFKLDYNANGSKMDLEKENISLKVINKISNPENNGVGGENEEAMNDIVVGVEGKFKPENKGAGAIIQALPGYVKSMFIILFIPALIALFAILKMKQEKEDNIV